MHRKQVIWPRLVADKIFRRRRPMGSNRFDVDYPEGFINEFGLSTDDHDTIPTENSPTITNKYKVFASTWNVGGVAPSDDINLEDWLDTCTNNPCDIYVLGFQEVVPLSARNVLGRENARISTKWNALIRAALNKNRLNSEEERNIQEMKVGEKKRVHPFKDGDHSKCMEVRGDFKCIISKQMVGIFISVWIRGDLRRFIRQASITNIGCGIMGCLGNKGSVAVSFRLHESSFCFVCSHLASGGKEGDEIDRNSDVVEILSRTSFPPGPSLDLPKKKILDHDRVIWLGDLNYRISMPATITRSLVEREDWDNLLQNDQLKAELVEGGVFEGWCEGAINFAPTYKYCSNSDKYFGYDHQSKKGKKRRAPAWCDRILWYGKGLKQNKYSRGESKISDHRPVHAIFTVDVEEFRNSKAFQNFFLFSSARFDQIANHF